MYNLNFPLALPIRLTLLGMTTFAHHFDIKGMFPEGLMNKFHTFDPYWDWVKSTNLGNK